MVEPKLAGGGVKQAATTPIVGAKTGLPLEIIDEARKRQSARLSPRFLSVKARRRDRD